MNSNSSNNLFSQSDTLFAKPYIKKIPNSSKDSPLPIEFEEQNHQNLKYFPIASEHSFTGKNHIRLSTEDSENKDINNSSNKENIDNYANKKVKKKSKNKQKLFMQQRSIEFQIKKTKFEYLLNLSIKNESKNNNKEQSDQKNNEVSKKDDEIYSIKEEIEEENKNNNYKNIKDDFMATTKKLFDKGKRRRNKSLNHSYSVENYSDFLNKDFLTNVNDNLQNLENSKIMENNFIGKFKNSSRKNNLMKLLEKYKRFKSYSHRLKSNDPLNKSFTFGFNQDKDKYRQTSNEKVYDMKNIIEEDENENSENETMRAKSNSKNIDKVKDIKYNILENKEKKVVKKSKEEIILAEKLKEIKSKANFQNVNDEIDNNININEFNPDEIDIDKLPNINHNNDIEIIQSIDENNNNTNNNRNDEINRDKFKSENNDKEIDINKIYFDRKNINKENEKEKSYNKYNKDKEIKSDITKEQKENYNPNNNNLINRINNIKNKIENNIFKNINCTKIKKKNNQEVLVRKILREERYIIDENGQEKVLEVNQSLLDSNNNFKFVVKNRRNKDSLSSINCITNNYTTSNLDEKISTKEKHLGKNHKILISEKNLDTIDSQSKNQKIKIEYSFKNSSRTGNDKVKRKYTCTSPISSIYKYTQSKTTQNSHKKERFHNINFQKINNPIVLKQMDKIFQRNSPNNNIYKSQYQNININNNLNHVIYIQSQTSPNKSPNYGKPFIKPEIPQRNQFSNFINKNHSYHEINSISDRKANTISKTIYHDYSNLDKRMIMNKSSTNIKNRQNNFNENMGGLSRNYSLNNFQRPAAKTSKDLIIENSYLYSDQSYKYKKNTSNDKIFDNMNNVFNSKYNRNVIKIDNKNKYVKRKKPANLIKKNTIFKGVPLGEDYFMNEQYIYEQNSSKVYPHSNSNNKYYKNPVKSSYIKEIDTFEEREYNL